jgi:hypothetical protein
MLQQVMGPGLDAELEYRRESLIRAADRSQRRTRRSRSRRGRAEQATQEPGAVLMTRHAA